MHASSISPLLTGRYLLLILLVVSFVGYFVLFQKEVQECAVIAKDRGSESEKEGIGEEIGKKESGVGGEGERIGGGKGQKGGKKENGLGGEREGEERGEIGGTGENRGGNCVDGGGGGRKGEEKEKGKYGGTDEECEHKFSGLSQLGIPSPFFSPFDPTVCIIARTFSGHNSVLPAFIASLASNNYPNVQIFLLDTQDDFHDMGRFADLFNNLYNKRFVHVSNISRKEARGRFPDWKEDFDFGYIQTDMLMRQLSNSSSVYKCDYFLVTNGDNLYSRDFFRYTLAPLRKKTDLVAVEFISHYCYEKSVPWRPRPGCYSQIYSEIVMSHIDLGAAMFRKDKIVELDASFILYYLERDPTGYGLQADFSDGYFFEFLERQGATVEIVHAALFVHQ